jgi:hypothetical protein
MNLPLSTTEYSLWIACAAFYIIDNIRIISWRRLILAENHHRYWSPVFPLSNFRIRNKTVVIMLLLPPWRAAIETGWLPPLAEPGGRVRLVRDVLKVISSITRSLGILGSIVFVNLFLVAPSVTALWGLGNAVIGAVIAHLVLLVLLTLLLSSTRSQWGMSWLQVAGQVFECAVCPGYFANIGRRLPLRYGSIAGDTIAYSYAIGRRTSRVISFQLGLLLEQVQTAESLTEDEQDYVTRFRRLLARGRDE